MPRCVLFFGVKVLLNIARGAAFACLLLLLSGCASRGSTVLPSAFPDEQPVGVSADLTDYRIGPQDLLSITVFQIKDLDREVRVNNAGQISLPLIGALNAAGRTVNELEQEIAAGYRARYLQDPQVSVFVKEFVSQRVTINGAVKKTGIFPMTSRLSLLQAVSLAEGLTDVADENNVVVFRRANGQRMVARFDLQAIREGSSEDPEILGDDVVVVAESTGEIAFKRFLQITPILTAWFLYTND
jgi:polysaccharide biosynthesis/export protein